ncbi:MAG: NYN domain-containing protein [Candidatus Paceibacterota bacterium]
MLVFLSIHKTFITVPKIFFGHKVNFAKIVEDALAGRKLIRSIAYVITSEAGDEQGFFEALNKNGIETKTKDLQVFMGGAKKGDWDVGLAVDAITLAPKIDAAIIISGDGDFVPLVQLSTNSILEFKLRLFRSRSRLHLQD